MPWIKEDKFYFSVLLLLILIMAVRTPLDNDIWWHIKAGEETWLNGEVYSIDTFSFTREGETWLAHSWLFEVIMFLLFRAGSYWALSVWVGLCAVISIALVYQQMESYSMIRVIVGILAGIVSSVVWSPRPQIVSLVLFSAVGYLLYLYKWKKVNRLLWLAPIFILWSNLHGGYIIGIVFMGALMCGELLNKILAENFTEHLSWGEIKILGIWILVCSLVVLINPFGLGMWKIPFITISVESLQNLISEWASPDFHQFYQQPMLWMFFGVIAAIGLSKRRVDGSDLVILIIFGVGAFTAKRNFGLFALATAPILTRHLEYFLADWKNTIVDKFPFARRWSSSISGTNDKIKFGYRYAANLTLILLLSTTVIWKVYDVNKPSFINQVEQDEFPVSAAEYLAKFSVTGRILNEYNWGGYLIWHLRDFPVFIDGRTDLFGDEIIGEWIRLLNAENGWQERLDYWNIDYILIRADRPLAAAAAETWETLISGEEIMLLGRKE